MFTLNFNYMKHVFYFMAIFPILWEFTSVCGIKRVHKFMIGMKGVKKLDDATDSQKYLSFLMLGYFIWVFIGFFSSQWIIFIGIILLSVIPKGNVIVRWIDSFLTLLLLVFLLINKYHLHINILDLMI